MTTGLSGGPPSGSAAASAPSTTAGASRPGGVSSTAHNPFASFLAGAVSAAEPAPVASTDGASLPTIADLAQESATHDDDLSDQILSLIGGDPWSFASPLAPTGDSDATVSVAGDLAIQAEPFLAALPADGSAAATVNGFNPPWSTSHSFPLASAQAPVIADTPDSGAAALGQTAGTDIKPTTSTDAAGPDTGDFILPGQQVLTISSTRNAAPAVVGAAVAMPADLDAGFDDSFGARIGWMADQRIGHAQIRVSPDNVGPIDVRLQLDGTRVSAEFVSANADVRQTLEASIGRLREMLDQQGLQLSHSDVGSGQSNSSGDREATASSQGNDAGADSNDSVGDLPEPVLMRRGLLDEYA